jgi:hypothetical protein
MKAIGYQASIDRLCNQPARTPPLGPAAHKRELVK